MMMTRPSFFNLKPNKGTLSADSLVLNKVMIELFFLSHAFLFKKEQKVKLALEYISNLRTIAKKCV